MQDFIGQSFPGLILQLTIWANAVDFWSVSKRSERISLRILPQHNFKSDLSKQISKSYEANVLKILNTHSLKELLFDKDNPLLDNF